MGSLVSQYCRLSTILTSILPEGRPQETTVSRENAYPERRQDCRTFEDGRIAHKTYRYIDNGENSSIDTGNSTYVFQNGDRLDLKLVLSAERAGGEYEVLSGTGTFEGATGTGSFYAADADWDGAYLWDGQFTLEMPAN